MKPGFLLRIATVAACAGPVSSQSRSEPTPIPRAAKIEASGFATIEQAPPSPFFDRLPPPENRARDERSYYAQLADISDAEAKKRLAEQAATRPIFEKLLSTLRKREKGNFTDARIVHKPDWAYVLYFKRNPERTLARYIKRAHFKAALARYSRAELDAIAKPWVDRFTQQRLLGGHGNDPTFGEVRMDVLVSEPEFRTIAAREKWQVPDAIRLQFSGGVAGSPISPTLGPLVRIFPQSDRALGATNQALLSGRIVLRDGCLFVSGVNQPDRLAYFGREVAIGLDEQGYVALRRRGSNPSDLGRIGESFSWAGPIGISEDMPMVRELRARCGNAPLQHVGVPQSTRLFSVRPYVVDAIAHRRKISRNEAWRRFKACLERREAIARYIDCDTL